MSDQPNANGGVTPNAAAASEAAPALTEERVSQMILAGVNSAVTSQLKRTLPKEIEGAMSGFKDSFATLLNENLTPIRQSFEARQKQEQEEREKAEKSRQPAATQANAELEALKKSMAEREAAQEKRLAAYEAKLKEADAKAEAERRKATEATAMTNLRSALTGVVQPDAVDLVADLLRARKQVEIADDGSLKMRIRAALMKGAPEEDHELPLAEALPHWTKTKEAGYFLPPPQTPGGAGAGSGRPPGGSANGGAPLKTGTGTTNDAFVAKFGKSLDQLV